MIYINRKGLRDKCNESFRGTKQRLGKNTNRKNEYSNGIALDLCVCKDCNISLLNKFGLPCYLLSCPKCDKLMTKPIFYQIQQLCSN